MLLCQKDILRKKTDIRAKILLNHLLRIKKRAINSKIAIEVGRILRAKTETPKNLKQRAKR